MMLPWRRLISLIVVVLAIAAAHTSPAAAHAYTDYYVTEQRWNGSYETFTSRWDVPNIEFHFSEGYYNGFGLAGEQRALDAMQSWSGAANYEFSFVNKGTLVADGDEVCRDTRPSVVRVQNLTNAPGQVTPCLKPEPTFIDGHREWSRRAFVITIDVDVRFPDNTPCHWYTGANTPPFNHCDLWGTLAHEVGHVAGQAIHFNEGPAADPSICSPAVAAGHAQTMCTGDNMYANDYPTLRSLEEHDTSTLRNAYGPNWPPPPSPPSTTTTVTTPPPKGGGLPTDHCHTLDDGGLHGIPVGCVI